MLFTRARVWPTASKSCAPQRSVNFALYPQLPLAPEQYHTASLRLQTLPTSPTTSTPHEHAELCPLSRTTHEAGERRMMRAATQHASSIDVVFFDFSIPGPEAVQTNIVFNKIEQPDMGLTFLPRPPSSRPNKRNRPVADIDGEHSCTQKKKRRLRRFLITSRLSPQYSHPATNIVDRGSSKIAVWAKQKGLGRNLLRKAAILNHIRRTTVSPQALFVQREQTLVEQEKEQEQFEMARLEFNHGSVDTYTRPVLSRTPSVPPSAAVRTGGHFVMSGSPSHSPSNSRSPSPTPPSPPPKGTSEVASDYRSPNEAFAYSPPRAQLPRKDYVPLPPSPLGLSNYDAFDVDEDSLDPYSHLDDDEPIPNPYDDLDDDETPFSPSAITSTSCTSAQTGPYQVLKTPPSALYVDFNILDHGEPVFGNYDQVDDAEAVWPSTFAKKASLAPTAIGSTSPNIEALLPTSSPPKRTDSFATALRPTSVSPNIPPSSTSPSFITPTTTAGPRSPNFLPASLSPNFAAANVPLDIQPKYKGPQETRKEHDIKEERRRQRDLMFMHFGS